VRKIITLCLFLFLSLSFGAVSVMARGEHSGRKDGNYGSSMHNRVRPGKQRLSNRRTTIREEETKVLSYLKENQPEAFKTLTRLKKSNPLKYREMLRKKAKQMYFLESLKERNPEQYKKVVRMGEMEQKSRKLAEEYKKAEDPKKRAAIKAELRGQINKLFEQSDCRKSWTSCRRISLNVTRVKRR